VRVVVDVDVSLPAALAARLGILAAPADAPLMEERQNIPRLLLEAGAPLEVAAVIEAARAAAASGSDVLYITGDGHGHPTGAETLAREAVEAAGGRFAHVEIEGVLMGAGWAAVRAAEAAEGGAGLDEAVAHASRATSRLLALIEHPELAGRETAGNPDTTNQILTYVTHEGFSLVSQPHRRDEGLRALRDGFAEAVAGLAGLRVVVHHAGVRPAAEAMATWIARHVQPGEVHVATITRHAATRWGPGFVGIAWTTEGADAEG
jgi:fatty acid-binding protein DegV